MVIMNMHKSKTTGSYWIACHCIVQQHMVCRIYSLSIYFKLRVIILKIKHNQYNGLVSCFVFACSENKLKFDQVTQKKKIE